MLSTESSKYTDVSDILESGELCVPISPNSFTSSVIGARLLCSPNFSVHRIIDMDLQDNLRSLRQSQALWAHNLWELSCAGFRHSAGFHARVILEGAACRLGEHGDVHDVLGVLGDDHVVLVVLRVLVSW